MVDEPLDNEFGTICCVPAIDEFAPVVLGWPPCLSELLTTIICAIQQEALNSYNHTYNNKDFYITKTENSKKLSFHIICQGLVFQKRIAVGSHRGTTFRRMTVCWN